MAEHKKFDSSEAQPQSRMASPAKAGVPMFKSMTRILAWAIGPAALLVVIHFIAPDLRDGAVYLPDAVARGEPWRWIAAHFVHRSHEHLGMNVLSWWVGCAALAPVLRRSDGWSWGVLAAPGAISCSLAVVEDQTAPFVGFSALFYAWLVAGAVQGLRIPTWRWVYGLLLAAIFVSIPAGWGWGGVFDGGVVARSPHLHGLFWGLLWGVSSDCVRSSSKGRGTRGRVCDGRDPFSKGGER